METKQVISPANAVSARGASFGVGPDGQALNQNSVSAEDQFIQIFAGMFSNEAMRKAVQLLSGQAEGVDFAATSQAEIVAREVDRQAHAESAKHEFEAAEECRHQEEHAAAEAPIDQSPQVDLSAVRSAEKAPSDMPEHDDAGAEEHRHPTKAQTSQLPAQTKPGARDESKLPAEKQATANPATPSTTQSLTPEVEAETAPSGAKTAAVQGLEEPRAAKARGVVRTAAADPMAAKALFGTSGANEGVDSTRGSNSGSSPAARLISSGAGLAAESSQLVRAAVRSGTLQNAGDAPALLRQAINPTAGSANGVFGSIGLAAGEETAKKTLAHTKSLSQLAQKTQTQIIEKIQQLLDTAAKSNDGRTISVRLEPAELGALTVRVTQRGDQLHARVIPESADVEQVLRNQVGEIAHSLALHGFKLENVQVSIGQERPESELFQFSYTSDRSGAKGDEEGLFRHSYSEAERSSTNDAAVLSGFASATGDQVSDGSWIA